MYNKQKVKLTEKLVKVKDILEHLEATSQQLHESTDKEALEEIERRQNIRRGLTNVNDACADFFQEVDKKLRQIQTFSNLNNDKELFL